MEEIWKDIVGYEGLYQVSNMGRIKSLNYNRTGKEKILKLGTNGGYLYVHLCKNGNRKSHNIHRLVLMTFNPVENSENLQVDHINTVRSDNRLENLRWTTAKENCNNSLSKIHYSEAKKGENAYLCGKFGAKHPNSIPIVQLTLNSELIEVYGSSHAPERSGFNHRNINSCIKGKRKTHGGYKWCYLHDYIANLHPNIKQINLFNKTYEVNRGDD